MRYLLPAAFLLASVATASADPVTVEAQGTGLTREIAVSKGLVAAIEQATGVTVDANTASSTVATSTITNHKADSSIIQATEETIARSAGGRVLSYNVESVDPAPEGGLLARLSVQIEVYHPKGMTTANRRRIAVADFAGGAPDTSLGANLRDKLLEYLTQSRRFAVVDRTSDAAYQNEMALVTGADAAPAERTRAGQVLGADYVITGHLAVRASKTVGKAAQSSSHALELTGEVVTNTTPSTLRTIAGSLSFDYEVIEIATRQISFAGHIDVSGQDVDAVAAKVTANIGSAIYPPRLVDISDPNALILNQGGAGVQQGQFFRIMQEGKELIDPYTHESLGKRESQLGVIQITEVNDKISYGKLVSGSVSGSADAMVLRPEKPAVEMQAAPVKHRAASRRNLASAPPAAPDTGLKLPFDH